MNGRSLEIIVVLKIILDNKILCFGYKKIVCETDKLRRLATQKTAREFGNSPKFPRVSELDLLLCNCNYQTIRIFIQSGF
jgi:hypothetical protein